MFRCILPYCNFLTEYDLALVSGLNRYIVVNGAMQKMYKVFWSKTNIHFVVKVCSRNITKLLQINMLIILRWRTGSGLCTSSVSINLIHKMLLFYYIIIRIRIFVLILFVKISYYCEEKSSYYMISLTIAMFSRNWHRQDTNYSKLN